jgi:glycosyltransferase involved in cell wall biosynthesis
MPSPPSELARGTRSSWEQGNRANRIASLLAGSPRALYRLGRRRLGRSSNAELYYVVPGANWATDRVGHRITSGVRRFGWPTHLTSTPHLLTDHVLHYGELWSFARSIGSPRNARNVVIATVFHADRDDRFPHLKAATEKLIANAGTAARIVTASRLMETRLVEWGIPQEKVVRIPLGVDLANFSPAAPEVKRSLRRALGVPEGALCIGSFQKDGIGWSEGLNPKLEKGPDTFVDVVRRLSRHHRLFVLLTGPARGYVSNGLERLRVPFRHETVPGHSSLPDYYRCLDVYLATARIEGGPHGVLEALATGVPVVSTRVGLVPDVIEHGHNGYLAEPEDVEALAELVARVAGTPGLAGTFSVNGLRSIQPYDWESIAARYFHELYRPLLQNTSAGARAR